MQIRNDFLANRLNLTREQMIAKYGEQGQTPIEQIANENNISVWDLVGDTFEKSNAGENTENENTENTLASILEPLKKILELLMGLFEKINNEKPEDKKADDTKTDDTKVSDRNAEYSDSSNNSAVMEGINLFTGTEVNIFEDTAVNTGKLAEKKTSTKKSTKKTSSSSKKDNVDSKTKKQDNKIKEVAEETGYDKKTVSAVVKAAATGNYTGAPESVVPKMAYDLGLPEAAVADILKHLNNGSI